MSLIAQATRESNDVELPQSSPYSNVTSMLAVKAYFTKVSTQEKPTYSPI
jgi:hypothetical protein